MTETLEFANEQKAHGAECCSLLKGQNPPHPKYAQKGEALCQVKLVRCTKDKHMISLKWGPW